LFQTIVILIGLTAVAVLAGNQAGGMEKVLAQAAADGKFSFFPTTSDAKALWAMVGAFFTFALGSIPQQDVFQRMTSAKTEGTAVRGTVIGGVVYFFFAFMAAFIAYAAIVTYPDIAKLFGSDDPRAVQRILPDLVMGKMPLWAQVMFFGALLSAILSTASGALLAPTALLTTNVIRPFVPHMSDRMFLLLLRTILVVFALLGLLFALNSRSTMYEMVQNAYKVTLVCAFVPLAAGVYWKKASTQGALLSAGMGILVWLAAETLAADAMVPPQLVGLLASTIFMVLGSLAPQLVKNHGHAVPRHTA
jgi:Na+/proline symporter